MALRKVFIQNREFIPDVAAITGEPIIQLEYEFDKAAILGKDVCVIEIDITPEQAAEVDRKARVRMERNKNDGERS